MSPFWILLQLRMMELVVTTGAIRRAKLQSNHHHQQITTLLFTGWMPFLLPNQQCQSTEGKSLPLNRSIYLVTGTLDSGIQLAEDGKTFLARSKNVNVRKQSALAALINSSKLSRRMAACCDEKWWHPENVKIIEQAENCSLVLKY